MDDMEEGSSKKDLQARKRKREGNAKENCYSYWNYTLQKKGRDISHIILSYESLIRTCSSAVCFYVRQLKRSDNKGITMNQQVSCVDSPCFSAGLEVVLSGNPYCSAGSYGIVPERPCGLDILPVIHHTAARSCHMPCVKSSCYPAMYGVLGTLSSEGRTQGQEHSSFVAKELSFRKVSSCFCKQPSYKCPRLKKQARGGQPRS